MYDITCSIVLFHNPPALIRCAVESVLQSSKKIKLFLVDNSADDSLRYEFISPQIEYIFTGKNIGYGSAHNKAIKKAISNSKYHLVLNPDVEFSPSILNRLFNFMEERSDIGLVMPKVLYPNGEMQYLCKRLPSPADLILRRFIPGSFKKIFKNKLEKYELKYRDYNTIMDIPNLSGCFMFLRTAALEVAGLFDERYFLYLEDTDLCRRINEYYRTVYYPRVSIIHGYSKASYKSVRLLGYHLMSTVRYFNKWSWFADRQRILINQSINTNQPIPILREVVLVTKRPAKINVLESRTTSSEQKVVTKRVLFPEAAEEVLAG